MKRRPTLPAIILVGAVIGLLYCLLPNAPAKVSPGPGSNGNDIFPCKVLTAYKPLLQPRWNLSVTGLKFKISRTEDSVLTSIWGANVQRSIVVDWGKGTVLPADIPDNTVGIGVCPQYVPDGMGLVADNGEIGFGSEKSRARVPFRQGVVAYPLALAEDCSVGFGTVYQDEPRQLEAIVCVNLDPPSLLGEVKMPPSKTVVWCIYDTTQKVLLVAEHEWNWIAMIDFSKPNTVKPAETPKAP